MCRLKRQAKNRVRHTRPWSIPPRATKNHNSPLVGLFSFGLAQLTAIRAGYRYIEMSFKRTNKLDIPVSVKCRFKRRLSIATACNVV